MKVSKRNWWVRWVRFGRFVGRDWQPSLCSLFWMGIFKTILTGCAGFALFVILKQVWRFPWDALKVVGIIVSVLACIAGVAYAAEAMPDKSRRVMDKVRSTVPYQGALAIKRRICPLIEWED